MGSEPEGGGSFRAPCREDYEVDRAARKASEEFDASRKRMLMLVERFKRHIYVEDPPPPGVADPDDNSDPGP